MRRISILEENFMALEGNIAEAIDVADGRVEETKSEVRGLVDSVMSQVQDKQNFHSDPVFVNFRNDPNVGLASMPQAIIKGISEAVAKLRDINVMGLKDIALLSKAYAALVGVGEESYNDEVDEAVFFFGRDNTDIPDSDKNVFVVRISPEAKQKGIERFIELQSVLSDAAARLAGVLNEGGDQEAFVGALEKMFLMKLVIEPILSSGGQGK